MFNFRVTTLVLRKFSINRESADEPAIEIVGRASGLMPWILTKMNLNTLTTLKLKGEELSVVYGSVSGETHTVIPVSAIESTQCGYSKTLAYLYLAFIALIYGLILRDASLFFALALLATEISVACGKLYFAKPRHTDLASSTTSAATV